MLSHESSHLYLHFSTPSVFSDFYATWLKTYRSSLVDILAWYLVLRQFMRAMTVPHEWQRNNTRNVEHRQRLDAIHTQPIVLK